MLDRLAQWSGGEGFPAIRADWVRRAAGLGEEIRIRVADREIVGRFQELDAAGCLVLMGPGGREVVCAGDLIALAAYPPVAPGVRTTDG
jgi:BirA family biotin operon repressor/biotin-[acetyl-CoA-carboxylase] ligase